MTISEQNKCYSVARFKRIKFLVHGFGTKNLKKNDLKRKPETKNFNYIFLRQIHSDIIHLIDKVPEKKLTGDAIITSDPFLLLIIKTADCLPILLVDRNKKVIAAVHCGWKGTSQWIINKVIERMKKELGCHPSSILAALGPCICPECYEVGEEVFYLYKKEHHSLRVFKKIPDKDKKYLLDLRLSNILQMKRAGVRENHIFGENRCTSDDEHLVSFRNNKREKSRMLNYIGMSF
ncbi:MAG: peptidoglycan editing factor PgeF [Candidatus Aminicenantaceae bacterium]